MSGTWQWDDESNGWKDYDSSIQLRLTALRPCGFIVVKLFGSDYTIDFKKMTQTKNSTKYTRTIRFVEDFVPAKAKQELPQGNFAIAKDGPTFKTTKRDMFGVPLKSRSAGWQQKRVLVAHNSVQVSVSGGTHRSSSAGQKNMHTMYTEVAGGEKFDHRGLDRTHSMRPATLQGAAPASTQIRQLSTDSQHFKRIVKRFQKKWRGTKYGDKTPEVIGVAEIMMNKKAHARYTSYANRVQLKMPAALERTKSMKEIGVKPGPGNTVYKFHATPCECDLMFRKEATPGVLTLCRKPSCGMCRIMEGDFDIGRAGTASGLLIGPGIYFTNNPHKADGYGNTGVMARTQAGLLSCKHMFLCDVVTGKQHHIARHQVFQRPPADHHSVVLDASPSNLQQDEVSLDSNGSL
jgi:hypothetical protein